MIDEITSSIIRLIMTSLHTESFEVTLRLEAKHADLARLVCSTHTHTCNCDDVEICRLNIRCTIVSRSDLQSNLNMQNMHTCMCKILNRNRRTIHTLFVHMQVRPAKEIPNLRWHFCLNELVWSQHQQAFLCQKDRWTKRGQASAQAFQSLHLSPYSIRSTET